MHRRAAPQPFTGSGHGVRVRPFHLGRPCFPSPSPPAGAVARDPRSPIGCTLDSTNASRTHRPRPAPCRRGRRSRSFESSARAAGSNGATGVAASRRVHQSPPRRRAACRGSPPRASPPPRPCSYAIPPASRRSRRTAANLDRHPSGLRIRAVRRAPPPRAVRRGPDRPQSPRGAPAAGSATARSPEVPSVAHAPPGQSSTRTAAAVDLDAFAE